MKCGKAKELLSEYMDGLLPQGQSEELGSHLKECASCARLLQELQGTVHLLREASYESAPTDFTATVLQKIAEKRTPAPLTERWAQWFRVPSLRPAFAAALTLILAALIGFKTLMPTPDAGDNAYLQAVVADHGSYAAQQPLTDGSMELVRSVMDAPDYR